MKDWKKYKLADLVEPDRGISYGVVQPGIFQKTGIPLIRVNNLTERKLNYNYLEKISPEIEKKYKRTRLQGNELLVSLVGSLGHICNVDKSMVGWNVARAIGVLPITKYFDKNWIYWVLKSPCIQEEFRTNATTSVQATLNLKELQDIEIPYPESTYRNKATSILSSLDDKIELNRRMNQTLEQMAQALFNHYFVDDIDVDNLPEGWNMGKIGEHIKTVLGGTPSTANKDFWESGHIPWINSGKLNDFRIIKPTTYITELALKKSNTTLLPKGTAVIAITGATMGQISRLEISSCANQSVVGLLANESFESEFIYLWLKKIKDDILSNSTGGAQQHVNKNNINSASLLIPPDTVMQKYLKSAKPIFNKIELNCFESNNLEKIRDTLLPKLMSGEIDVSVLDGEKLKENYATENILNA